MSGGPDSLALLALAAAAGCRVTAVHVDHGLRPGSASEAGVVASRAAEVGAAFEGHRVDVGPGPNLEARARRARRAVLGAGAFTGHTADDQAETVLLALLRGAGLDGLSGMRPEGHPLLGLRRAETHALVAALGWAPVLDPTNAEAVARRNRVRHEVLPLLDDVAGRDVAALVARTADLLAADAEVLESLAAGLDPTDVRALAAAPEPLARRALRRWLRAPSADAGVPAGARAAHAVDVYPPSAGDLERVMAVVRGEARATEITGGRRVARRRGRLFVGPAGSGPG